MTDEMILVPRAELLAWAKEWLYENYPGDGTDCVTPFDTYLLKSPAEAQPNEHVEVLRELRDTGDVSDWRAMESALDAAIASLSAQQPPVEARRCTCPSGDGSLRWPCPAHPPEAQPVAGDAVAVIEEMRSRMSSRGRVGDGPVYGGELIDWANRLEAALAQQPSVAPVGVEGLVQSVRALSARWKSKVIDGEPVSEAQHMQLVGCAAMLDSLLDNLAQQPAAVDDLNAWRAAFIAERATRYREGGMSIEQARIHAETDATLMEQAASQPQGGEVT